MNQNNRIYLITYSIQYSSIYRNLDIHKGITNLVNLGVITDWWYYIENTYLVVYSEDANTLYNQIYHSSSIHAPTGLPSTVGGLPSLSDQILGTSNNLLVTEVNPKNMQGHLPKEAWDWINKYRPNNN